MPFAQQPQTATGNASTTSQEEARAAARLQMDMNEEAMAANSVSKHQDVRRLGMMLGLDSIDRNLQVEDAAAKRHMDAAHAMLTAGEGVNDSDGDGDNGAEPGAEEMRIVSAGNVTIHAPQPAPPLEPPPPIKPPDPVRPVDPVRPPAPPERPFWLRALPWVLAAAALTGWLVTWLGGEPDTNYEMRLQGGERPVETGGE